MVAVFIDVSGKQKYIFESNQLKDNIGASYIISNKIFGETLLSSLKEIKIDDKKFSLDNWKNSDTLNSKFDVAYIGGGNALLLFEGKEKAKAFNKYFSKSILIQFPGVYINLTIKEGFTENKFKEFKGELIQLLKKETGEQANYNEPYIYGIEQECDRTGKSKEVYNRLVKSLISKEADSKIDNAKKSENSNNKLIENKSYVFTNEINKIVTDDEKGYMSVVHIDGNKMGSRFEKCETLSNFRKESTEIDNILQEILNSIIEELIKLIDVDDENKKIIKIDEFNNIELQTTEIKNEKEEKETKWILPFRSIINAGDDITFVCHGRLGIFLAELYLNKLAEKGVYACAGITLAHTKYPFYKAYLLAEELASSGKKASRKYEKGTSWIQFFKAPNGFVGDLKSITTKQHGQNDYKTKPYLVIEEDSENNSVKEASFTEVKETLQTLQIDWTRNKAMQYREALKTNNLEDFIKIAENKEFKLSSNENIVYEAIDMIGFYKMIEKK